MGGSGATGSCLTPPCGGGGGISDRLYQGQLKRAIQAAISGDSRVNKFVFTNNFAIVVTPGGRITSVQMRTGSGKTNVDRTLTQILEGLSVPPPPVKSQYPIVIQVRGRSQFGG
jgi:TonB family protein